MAQPELVNPKELIEKPTFDYIQHFNALKQEMRDLHSKVDKLP